MTSFGSLKNVLLKLKLQDIASLDKSMLAVLPFVKTNVNTASTHSTVAWSLLVCRICLTYSITTARCSMSQISRVL